ncbi:MAG TPA: sigma-70 family RNA polymerase sigma factor [Thermoanaerobaculia bacterium]|nr:sigma-70 family RNA polymerase sigma factor [Thermoanaerobaculia bacterium]
MGFEADVARHQRRVFSFAHYFLDNREEAEDVTQEVLLRFWRHGSGLDPDGVGAWLLRVTRNACYDQLRRRRSAAVNLPTAGFDVEEAAESVAAPEPGPESQAVAADFRRRLQEALGRLPDPYRSVLILREIQDLSYQEISDLLELPLNTVRVHIHRGRQRLREELREDYGDAAVG